MHYRIVRIVGNCTSVPLAEGDVHGSPASNNRHANTKKSNSHKTTTKHHYLSSKPPRFISALNLDCVLALLESFPRVQGAYNLHPQCYGDCCHSESYLGKAVRPCRPSFILLLLDLLIQDTFSIVSEYSCGSFPSNGHRPYLHYT